MNTQSAPPGFYGKSPALGDFISRQLPRDFIDPWDGWLQSCLAFSKEELGQYWLDTYLTSPIWRFVLSARVAGPSGWTGAMMPSVDRVGRSFPLTIAMPMEAESDPWPLLTDGAPWFEQVESELLSALDEERFDIEDFERRVAGLGEVTDRQMSDQHRGLAAPGMLGAPWRISLGSLDNLSGRVAEISSALMSAVYGDFSLWWTAGSDYIQPSLLVCRGLPPPQGYTSMIAAQWTAGGWQDSSPQPLPQDDMVEALGSAPSSDR